MMSRWRHKTMHGLRISVADAVLDLDDDGNVINGDDVTPTAAQKMRSVSGWVEVPVAKRDAVPTPPEAPNTPAPTVEPEPAPVAPQDIAEPVKAAPASQPLTASAEPRKGKKR